jgi:hypothetical protein
MAPYLRGALNNLMDNSSAVQNNGIVPVTGEVLILANAINELDVSSGIVLSGAVYVTPGAACKAVTVRVRRGYGTSGAIDWEIRFPVTPYLQNCLPIAGVVGPDVYFNSGGGQHSVTLSQESATSTGHVGYASVAFFNSVVAAMGLRLS